MALKDKLVNLEDLAVVNDEVTDLKNAFDEVDDAFTYAYGSNNYCPPDTESGYYDTSTGAKVASGNHARTPNPIYIPEDSTKVYMHVNNMPTNGLIDILFYSSKETSSFISQVSSIAAINVFNVPTGAKYLRAWINNSAFSFENMAFWTSNEAYVAYNGQYKSIKKHNIDNTVVEQIDNNTERIEDCEDMVDLFDKFIGENICPPNTELGYYKTDTGAPYPDGRYVRTPNAIDLNGAGSFTVILKNAPASSMLLCYCYYSGEATSTFISATSNTLSSSAMFAVKEVPQNAKYVRLWAGDNTFSFENLSLVIGTGQTYIPYDTEKYSLPGVVVDKKLQNRTIVNFGDSVFGLFWQPDDISSMLEEYTGADVYNCAFGGCHMAVHSDSKYDAFSMYRLAYAIANNDWSLQQTAISSSWSGKPWYFNGHYWLLKNIDFSKVDIITIAFGTNDITSGILLDNPNNPYDTTKYKGALRYSIETLLTAFPNLRIFVCTPTYRFWMNGQGEFEEDSNTKQFDGGTMIDFVNACEDVSKEYNIPCINNYYIGMGKYSRSYYFPADDGVHPNINGRKIIADHISNELY